MSIHDWTRVSAGTFHDFHNRWIAHLTERLNLGTLPAGFYARSEQPERHGLGIVADILALKRPDRQTSVPDDNGPVATMAPPRVSRRYKLSEKEVYRRLRRTLTVRHQSGDQIVAVVEIISRANKDRPKSVAMFVNKVTACLSQGINVLIVDLFPPGKHDPNGLHAEIWDAADPDDEPLPADKPLIAASYEAGPGPVALVEPLAVGDVMPDMPLYLEPELYVYVPLQAAYDETYRGQPQFDRDVLEGRAGPEATAPPMR